MKPLSQTFYESISEPVHAKHNTQLECRLLDWCFHKILVFIKIFIFFTHFGNLIRENTENIPKILQNAHKVIIKHLRIDIMIPNIIIINAFHKLCCLYSNKYGIPWMQQTSGITIDLYKSDTCMDSLFHSKNWHNVYYGLFKQNLTNSVSRTNRHWFKLNKKEVTKQTKRILANFTECGWHIECSLQGNCVHLKLLPAWIHF